MIRGQTKDFIYLDELSGFNYYPDGCIVILDEWDYSQIGISAYNPIGLKRLNIINPTWHCIIILEEF